MFLSTNSIIHVISRLVLIDFSHFKLYFPVLFCFECLIVFNWMPDIENFNLLGAGHICIPINILEFCSGKQLSYLEIDCFNSDC